MWVYLLLARVHRVQLRSDPCACTSVAQCYSSGVDVAPWCGCVDDEYCDTVGAGCGTPSELFAGAWYRACVAPPSPPPHPSACADPLYVDQWHLRRVRAEEAWDVVGDSSSTVVVVDDGVQYAHGDLDVDRARSSRRSSATRARACRRRTRRTRSTARRIAGVAAAVRLNRARRLRRRARTRPSWACACSSTTRRASS